MLHTEQNRKKEAIAQSALQTACFSSLIFLLHIYVPGIAFQERIHGELEECLQRHGKNDKV